MKTRTHAWALGRNVPITWRASMWTFEFRYYRADSTTSCTLADALLFDTKKSALAFQRRFLLPRDVVLLRVETIDGALRARIAK